MKWNCGGDIGSVGEVGFASSRVSGFKVWSLGLRVESCRVGDEDLTTIYTLSVCR